AFSPPIITKRTEAGGDCVETDISYTHTCQKAVGKFRTVIFSLSITSTKLDRSSSFVSNTSVAPLNKVGKISSTDASKLTEANCNTRSCGVKSNISDTAFW